MWSRVKRCCSSSSNSSAKGIAGGCALRRCSVGDDESLHWQERVQYATGALRLCDNCCQACSALLCEASSLKLASFGEVHCLRCCTCLPDLTVSSGASASKIGSLVETVKFGAPFWVPSVGWDASHMVRVGLVQGVISAGWLIRGCRGVFCEVCTIVCLQLRICLHQVEVRHTVWAWLKRWCFGVLFSMGW
jgi:hypothetical protein